MLPERPTQKKDEAGEKGSAVDTPADNVNSGLDFFGDTSVDIVNSGLDGVVGPVHSSPNETNESLPILNGAKEVLSNTISNVPMNDAISNSEIHDSIINNEGNVIGTVLNNEGNVEGTVTNSVEPILNSGVNELTLNSEINEPILNSEYVDDTDGVLNERLDRYGFITNDRERETDPTTYLVRHRQTYFSTVETKRQMKYRVRRESLRAIKWFKMIETWDRQVTRKCSRLNSRVRKGIPDSMRDKSWELLVELHHNASNCSICDVAPYETLLAECSASEDPEIVHYRDCISRDISRTFPRHAIFHREGGMGQSALTNVLRAYVPLDKVVGYCQGMGFIVGMFLSYMPERKAFKMLRHIMLSEPWSMNEQFKPGMPGAQLLLHQYEVLLMKHIPDLATHLNKENVVPSMYATQWFITVFTYNFPFDIVVRVWDIFLLDGWPIVHQMAIAIMKVHRKTILSKDFEQILEFIKTLPSRLDPESIMELARKVPITHEVLRNIRLK